MKRKIDIFTAVAAICAFPRHSHAFSFHDFRRNGCSTFTRMHVKLQEVGSPLELGPIPQQELPMTLKTAGVSTVEGAKAKLMMICPNMTGKNSQENDLVEDLINFLEEEYKASTPIQTVAFFDLAIGGTWELLMSTNMVGKTSKSPSESDELLGVFDDNELGMRLKLVNGLSQIIDTEKRQMVNEVEWEVDGSQDCWHGKFSTVSRYDLVNQSTRLITKLEEHVLDNKTKGRVPSGEVVNEIVSGLIDEMSIELFDPHNLSCDTTYVDGDIRIVRYTAGDGRNTSEGVRNIFLRSK